jgi:hypothetical protein
MWFKNIFLSKVIADSKRQAKPKKKKKPTLQCVDGEHFHCLVPNLHQKLLTNKK